MYQSIRYRFLFFAMFLATFTSVPLVWAETDIQALLAKDPKTLTAEERELILKNPETLTEEQKQEKRSALQASLNLPAVIANTPGAVNCFDSYRFGSVQVDVTPTLASTVPGAQIGFVGHIKNANDYPIVAGQVYAKVFFKKNQDEALSHQNGFALVDQFIVKGDISLKAQGEQNLAFVWDVPQAAETGEYQVAFYFTSAERYNLLGLSFTDDVTGNTADFSVLGAANTAIAFDKNAVTLNQNTYAFAAFPPTFAQDESVVVKTPLTNPKDTDVTLTVSWKHYAWDGLREEALRDTHEEVVFLKARETKTLSYTADAIDSSVSYLVVEAKDRDMKSLLDIRFVREGIDEVRINFPSINTYPLEKGTEAAVFACVHSTSQQIVKDNTLTLTLKNDKGRVIHTYRYEGDITGDMMGLKDQFMPEQTHANFSLTATLEHDGEVVEEVTQTYDCREIDEALCPKLASGIIPDIVIGQRVSLLITLVLAFLLGMLAWKLLRGRRGSGNRLMSFLFAVVITSACFWSGVSQAEAKSVTWNTSALSSLYYHCQGFYSGKCGTNSNLSVMYAGNVYDVDSGALLNDGAVIPVGAKLNVTPKPFIDQDISWYFQGWAYDSPYGYWGVGGSLSTIPKVYAPIYLAGLYYLGYWDWTYAVGIHSKDYGDIGHELVSWFDMQVIANPPSLSVTTSPTLSCGAFNGTAFPCTVTGAGAVNTSINFSPTYAKAYSSWTGALGGFSIPAQSIPFTFTAVGGNNPPTPPIITGPNAGLSGTPQNFAFLSTDPDGDTLRYGIDWDNNGSVDQWAPSLGHVASGTSQSASHVWPTVGSYTFKALAQDSKGAYSGWTNHSIIISASPTLSFFGVPTMLPYTGGTTTLTWSTGRASSCWASNGWTGWQTINGSAVRPVTATTVFSLECWDGYGVSTGLQSVVVTVADPPRPVIDLKINGSNGPISLDQGELRHFTWTAANATSCTAASSDGWSGSKSATSGSESLAANVTSNHTLTCTGPGGVISDSVQVNVSCTPVEGTYGACNCATETKTRSNLLSSCAYAPEVTECTTEEKNACRDFNWREVAP